MLKSYDKWIIYLTIPNYELWKEHVQEILTKKISLLRNVM